jgi:hypothetical protein
MTNNEGLENKRDGEPEDFEYIDCDPGISPETNEDDECVFCKE